MKTFMCAVIAALVTIITTQKSYGSDWADSVLTSLTLEEKIGQLIFPELRPGPDADTTETDTWSGAEEQIKRYGVGGFVLFGGKYPDVIEKIEHLQEVSSVPLLFTADFEKGAGQKIWGATLFPPNMALGASGSQDLAYRIGAITARQGRELGIGMTLSPVLDVNSNPDNPIINVRSFGEDPVLVSRLGESYIRGCRENGMLTTGKHFPGHGDTEVDSHTGLPVIRRDRTSFENLELLPFKNAINAGVDAIMVGHLSVPALDTSGTAASISGPIMRDLLRYEMGFRGLVITDALIMEALKQEGDPGCICRKALQGGADILLMPEDISLCRDSILSAVSSGAIKPETVDAAVERILTSKKNVPPGDGDEIISRDRMHDLLVEGALTAGELARKSITMLENKGGIIPISTETDRILSINVRADSLLPTASFFHERLETELEGGYEKLEVLSEPDSAAIEEISDKADSADLIVLVIVSKVRAYRGYPGLPATVSSLLRRIIKPEKCIILSLGNPYVIRDLPGTHGILLAYGTDRYSQRAAASVLSGKLKTTGRLPVTIPGMYRAGSGLVME